MKLLMILMLMTVVVSNAHARSAAWVEEARAETDYGYHLDDVLTVPNTDTGVNKPTIPAVHPSHIAQNKAKVSRHHHESWWDKHGNEVIIGTAVTAVFIGVAVYAFGMEQSQNDPTKVTIMKF